MNDMLRNLQILLDFCKSNLKTWEKQLFLHPTLFPINPQNHDPMQRDLPYRGQEYDTLHMQLHPLHSHESLF